MSQIGTTIVNLQNSNPRSCNMQDFPFTKLSVYFGKYISFLFVLVPFIWMLINELKNVSWSFIQLILFLCSRTFVRRQHIDVWHHLLYIFYIRWLALDKLKHHNIDINCINDHKVFFKIHFCHLSYVREPIYFINHMGMFCWHVLWLSPWLVSWWVYWF